MHQVVGGNNQTKDTQSYLPVEELSDGDAKPLSEPLGLSSPVGDAVGDGFGDLFDQDQAQLGGGKRTHRHVA